MGHFVLYLLLLVLLGATTVLTRVCGPLPIAVYLYTASPVGRPRRRSHANT